SPRRGPAPQTVHGYTDLSSRLCASLLHQRPSPPPETRKIGQHAPQTAWAHGPITPRRTLPDTLSGSSRQEVSQGVGGGDVVLEGDEVTPGLVEVLRFAGQQADGLFCGVLLALDSFVVASPLRLTLDDPVGAVGGQDHEIRVVVILWCVGDDSAFVRVETLPPHHVRVEVEDLRQAVLAGEGVEDRSLEQPLGPGAVVLTLPEASGRLRRVLGHRQTLEDLPAKAE